MKLGTFNLASLWERLGIKNPSLADFAEVAPVIVVGQFGHLTPYMEAPTYIGGGDFNAVALEFNIFTISALAPGGALLHVFTGNSNLRFGIRAPVAGLTVVPDRGPLSFDAAQLVVRQGSNVAQQLVGVFPTHSSSTPVFPMFIPPGLTLALETEVVNQATSNTFILAQDVVATEMRPAD